MCDAGGGAGDPRPVTVETGDRGSALRMTEELMEMVAHDLRSPLACVLANAELLAEWARRTQEGAEPARAADIIVRSVDRMERLLADILDLTKVEQGRLLLMPEELGVERVLAAILESHEAVAAKRGVELETSVSPGTPPLVRADSDRLMQILSNLVTNAIKFVPEGARVSMRAERGADDGVRFSVADTGPGIPPEQRERLFDRYWRGEVRRAQGTGLGLAIARRLVEAHGGRIWVESELGRGTTFFFELAPGSGPGD